MGVPQVDVGRWSRSHAGDLAALADIALPGENLTADELEACCWDEPDPSVVLAVGGGEGALAGVVHVVGDRAVAFVQLVAVGPEHRRLGHGRSLLDAFAAWAFTEHGASALAVGGCGPFYLWPGVDVHATAALCLFESAGFRPKGAELNLSFLTGHRAPAPPGIELRRVLADADAAAALDFVGRHWPGWVAETARAVDHGTCHIALASDATVVGFGCHSVNRLGWLGPMGTDPQRRSSGVGRALTSAIATDLMAAGLASVEVSWVGPIGFYAKAADATVSRAFRTLVVEKAGFRTLSR